MPSASASGPIGKPFYDALIRSEEAVRLAVPPVLGTPIILVAQASDVLLALSGYHGNSDAEVNSPDHLFYWWAYERASQVLFSLRASILLWDAGHYIECVTLIKHLVEAFVQLRYFDANRPALRQHIMARRRKDRVTFRMMFDRFSTGFFDSQYAALYANVSHSGLAFSVMTARLPARDGELAKPSRGFGANSIRTRRRSQQTH